MNFLFYSNWTVCHCCCCVVREKKINFCLCLISAETKMDSFFSEFRPKKNCSEEKKKQIRIDIGKRRRIDCNLWTSCDERLRNNNLIKIIKFYGNQLSATFLRFISKMFIFWGGIWKMVLSPEHVCKFKKKWPSAIFCSGASRMCSIVRRFRGIQSLKMNYLHADCPFKISANEMM